MDAASVAPAGREAQAERALEALADDRRLEIAPLLLRFRWLQLLAARDGLLTLHAREIRSGIHYVVRVATVRAQLDPATHDLIATECALVERLSHRNIAPLEDIGVPGAGAYCLPGLTRLRTLEDVLDGPELPPEAVIDLLRQVAAALDSAHGAGVVHGSLAPTAVIVDERSDVRVIGLGRATEVDGAAGQSGLPAYRAPEQWTGEAVVPSTDQYALAIIACELLGGQRRRVVEAPTPLEEIAPVDVPVRPGWSAGTVLQLTAVLRRALGRSPNKRYPSASAFVEALDRAFSRSSDQALRAVESVPSSMRRSGTAVALLVSASILLIAAGASSPQVRSDARGVGLRLWSGTMSLVGRAPEQLSVEQRVPPVGLPATGAPSRSRAAPAQAPTTRPVADVTPLVEEQPLVGFVRVQLEGGTGRIVANGLELGDAPGVVPLPPGAHVLSIISSGSSANPGSRRVTVRAGDTVSTSFRLVQSIPNP